MTIKKCIYCGHNLNGRQEKYCGSGCERAVLKEKRDANPAPRREYRHRVGIDIAQRKTDRVATIQALAEKIEAIGKKMPVDRPLWWLQIYAHVDPETRRLERT